MILGFFPASKTSRMQQVSANGAERAVYIANYGRGFAFSGQLGVVWCCILRAGTDGGGDYVREISSRIIANVRRSAEEAMRYFNPDFRVIL